MELTDIHSQLAGLPVRWNRSTFGPATIHVRGQGAWSRLNIYVQEEDFPSFAHDISALMNILPVWTAMTRFCQGERASWTTGYLQVGKSLLPSGGVYLPRTRFNPDQHIQASTPAEALACKRGMLAFLNQLPEPAVSSTPPSSVA